MQHRSLPGALAFSYKIIISLFSLSYIAACATLPLTNSSRLFQTENECTSSSDWVGHSPPNEVSALEHFLLLSDNDRSSKVDANRVTLNRKTAMLL